MPEKPTLNKKSAKTRQNEFYLKVLDEAEKLDFQAASNIEGIDDEIALLRLKIREMAKDKDKNNLKLMMAVTGMLAKLVQARYNMTKNQKKGLKEAIGAILKDYAVPIGTALLQK